MGGEVERSVSVLEFLPKANVDDTGLLVAAVFPKEKGIGRVDGGIVVPVLAGAVVDAPNLKGAGPDSVLD